MMSAVQDVNEQNRVAVTLMQALWGVISPNFRMVALSVERPVWQLHFVLEKEDPVDREEIEDSVAEFDSLLDSGGCKFEVKIEVIAIDLLWPDQSFFVVYRRRE
ncbi:MAG: hypothetical protein QM639_13960 [Rhodocyclaceae bacterium]